jgi:hypothetical protein
MIPTSLPARLLALTPHGKRLFALLAEQQREIIRLREIVRAPPDSTANSPSAGEAAAVQALLRAAEAEAEFLGASTD